MTAEGLKPVGVVARYRLWKSDVTVNRCKYVKCAKNDLLQLMMM